MLTRIQSLIDRHIKLLAIVAFTLLIGSLFYSSVNNLNNKSEEGSVSSYEGIEAGKSPVSDVSKLGDFLKKEEVGNGTVKYTYEEYGKEVEVKDGKITFLKYLVTVRRHPAVYKEIQDQKQDFSMYLDYDDGEYPANVYLEKGMAVVLFPLGDVKDTGGIFEVRYFPPTDRQTFLEKYSGGLTLRNPVLDRNSSESSY